MRVFLASPWIPAEWVRAHGLAPQGLWFSNKFRRLAQPLSAGTCAFAESVVQFAGSLTDATVIFSTACDQLRRGFDAAMLDGAAGAFLFNLPATSTAAARQIYRAELERLGRCLQQLGGRAPAPEGLRAEMISTEQARQSLRSAAPLADAASFARSLARFCSEGSFSPPSPARPAGRLPLAIVGGPLSMTDWPLFEVIEAVGGRVVLNATDTGERILCPAPDPEGDPFSALADGYWENMTDVFQRPNARLYSWLRSRLSSRQVRGIVLWCFTNCDLWRAERQTLHEAFGLPVLLLEAGEAAGLSARDVNRLQAFVETLS